MLPKNTTRDDQQFVPESWQSVTKFSGRPSIGTPCCSPLPQFLRFGSRRHKKHKCCCSDGNEGSQHVCKLLMTAKTTNGRRTLAKRLDSPQWEARQTRHLKSIFSVECSLSITSKHTAPRASQAASQTSHRCLVDRVVVPRPEQELWGSSPQDLRAAVQRGSQSPRQQKRRHRRGRSGPGTPPEQPTTPSRSGRTCWLSGENTAELTEPP